MKLVDDVTRSFWCVTRQAALGPGGTDGGFRQAAGAALGALRWESHALVALLAAVVGDPLVPWSAAEGVEGSAARKVRRLVPPGSRAE